MATKDFWDNAFKQLENMPDEKFKEIVNKVVDTEDTSNDSVYVYESHMGGLFFSEDVMEDTYCEECGDYDLYIGVVYNRNELVQLLINQEYDSEYINDILEDYERYIERNK